MRSSSMKVDVHELRSSMAMRPDDELVEIIANARGLYTATAVDTARIELASRPPRSSDAEEMREGGRPRSRYLTHGDFVPLGIRMTLWFALAFAIGSSLSLIIGVILTSAGALSSQDAPEFVQYGGAALISSWIVLAIKRRYAYGRTLLIAVVGTWSLYCLAFEVVQRDWSLIPAIFSLDLRALWRFAVSQQAAEHPAFLNDLTTPVVAFFYFLLNRNAAAYFHVHPAKNAAQQIAAAG